MATTFKKFLAEESGGWITDKSEAVKWIADREVGFSHLMTDERLEQVSHDMFSINRPDGAQWKNCWPIHITASGSKLRVKFKETASFSIRGPLRTLEGCPEIVHSDFRVDSDNLTSFQYAPRIINGDAVFSGLHLQSLEGISDIIDEIHGTISLSLHIKSGGLGLVLIKGLISIHGPNPLSHDMHGGEQGSWKNGWNKPWEAAVKIINPYLGRPNDIFECQNELIEAGLEEFAKL